MLIATTLTFASQSLTRSEIVLAGLATVPPIGCPGWSPAKSQPERWSAGSTNGLRADTWAERHIRLLEGAGEVGRQRVFARLRGEGAAALSSSCTWRPEEGPCPVRWIDAGQRFVCPCHGGVYDERGTALAGAKGRLRSRRPASRATRSTSADGLAWRQS